FPTRRSSDLCTENLRGRVDKAQIALIRNRVRITLRNDFHNLLELSGRNHATRWIGRRVQNNQPGSRRDRSSDHLSRKHKTILFSLNKNGFAARKSHNLRKGYPVGFRKQDLVVGVEQGSSRIKNGLLAAGCGHHFTPLVP